eukprot:PLAT9711.1.p1 GENE.PLAT9711.1~~PLAT9711.1.p1  ORF type:complete len:186 (-),score=68.37 PLAT9711.1:259-816(-)
MATRKWLGIIDPSDNCCLCFSPRLGVLLLGLVDIVGGVGAMIDVISATNDLDNLPAVQNGDGSALLVIGGAFSLFTLLFGFIAVYGSYAGRKNFCYTYYCWKFVQLFTGVLVDIVRIAVSQTDCEERQGDQIGENIRDTDEFCADFKNTLYLTLMFRVILQGYFAYVSWSYANEPKKKKKRAGRR